MNIIKTNFNLKVNKSSSWIIYITKSLEEAHTIRQIAEAQIDVMRDMSEDWYSTESIARVYKDCRVPSFFHDKDYWVLVIEHNQGDWDKEPTYALYIVD